MKARKRKPTPVGEMLREEFLIPLGLTQKEFAHHLGLEVKAINRLINNKTSVNPTLALKIASALGTTPEFWMNLQIANDLWELKNSNIELPSLISA
ncbi:MAG: HigA family addiction module antidote protein [Oligoflexia bacterium]|nr:HigA family addiction module antidote protein [Oligoflexia bacterium]